MGESMCSNTLWQVHSYSASFSSSYTKMHRENDALRNGAPSLKMTKKKGAAGGLKQATTTKKGKRNASGRH